VRIIFIRYILWYAEIQYRRDLWVVMTFSEKENTACIFTDIEVMEAEIFSECLLFTYHNTLHSVVPSEISLRFSKIHGTSG